MHAHPSTHTTHHPAGCGPGARQGDAASSRSNSLLRDAKVRAPHPPQTKSEKLEQQGSPAPRGTGCHHPGGGRTSEVEKEPPASATFITRQDGGAPPAGFLGGWGRASTLQSKCLNATVLWVSSPRGQMFSSGCLLIPEGTQPQLCLLPAHVVLKSGCKTVDDTRLTPFCRATGEPGDRRLRRPETGGDQRPEETGDRRPETGGGDAFTLNPKSRVSTDADSMRLERE